MPRLLDVLAPLEQKTPDKIAELFTEMNIKGRRYQACRCPVARYIAKETEHDPWAIAVGTDRIELWDSEEGFVTNLDVYHLGQEGPLYDFIIKFDNGGYPDLMEE